MATQPIKGLKFLKNLYGANQPIESFPEAASQTFKEGDLVYLSSGYVTICSADPTAILGIAMADGSNAASSGDNEVLVMLLENGVFVTNCYTTSAATMVGTTQDLYYASHVWYVESATSAPRVVVKKILDTVGDTYGRVEIVFIHKYLQLTGNNI